MLQGDSPSEGALSKEALFRSLASEHLLSQIGVDIEKFMSQKLVEQNLGPKPQDLAKLMGVSMPPIMDEDEQDDEIPTGLPNPLQMPSIS